MTEALVCGLCFQTRPMFYPIFRRNAFWKNSGGCNALGNWEGGNLASSPRIKAIICNPFAKIGGLRSSSETQDPTTRVRNLTVFHGTHTTPLGIEQSPRSLSHLRQIPSLSERLHTHIFPVSSRLVHFGNIWVKILCIGPTSGSQGVLPSLRKSISSKFFVS